MRAFSFFRQKQQKRNPANVQAGMVDLAESLAQNAEAYHMPGYGRYLLAAFRRTSPYVLWQRARDAFAPAIFLSRAFRVLRWTLRILEASALLLLLLALLLVATPVLLVLFLSFLSAVLTNRRRTDRILAPRLENKRVLLLFSPVACASVARVFAPLCSEYTILLVVPFFSPSEIAAHFPLSHAAYRRADGVILVREHYYFHLARHLLGRSAFCARIF